MVSVSGGGGSSSWRPTEKTRLLLGKRSSAHGMHACLHVCMNTHDVYLHGGRKTLKLIGFINIPHC